MSRGVIRQRQHNWALIALVMVGFALSACGRQNNAAGAAIPLSGGGTSVAAVRPVNPAIAPTPVSVGTLSVQVGAVKAGTIKLNGLNITLSGTGLLNPLTKRLSLADLANQNTIGFEQVPSGVKTLTVQALNGGGATVGQQVLECVIPANGIKQVGTTLEAGSVPDAVLVRILEGPIGTTPSPNGGAQPVAGATDERSLSVEVTSKRAIRKLVLVKTLEVGLRVINRSRTEAFAGVVTIQYRKGGGLLSRDNQVVETKTASVPRLAPGQEHLITLQSSKAADDADVSVHTVLDTQQASTRAAR